MATSARITVAEQKRTDRKVADLHKRLDRVEKAMAEDVAKLERLQRELEEARS